jgi:hypothetical protein
VGRGRRKERKKGNAEGEGEGGGGGGEGWEREIARERVKRREDEGGFPAPHPTTYYALSLHPKAPDSKRERRYTTASKIYV